jgi:alanine racemase
MLPAARAALAGGADVLGVAVVEEALALRAAGITAPVLAWLNGPGEDFAAALRADVEVSVNAEWGLAEVVDAARATGRTARVHLFADTGLSREGATPADWPGLVAAAAKAQAGGEVEVTGLWSHLAYADAPTHPTIGAQQRAFEEAVGIARDAGLSGARRHLANSAATIALPETWYDMVRPGVAVYGLDPLGGDPAPYGLRPAMTVRARVALTKRVPAGVGVSYGHTYHPDRETTLALVPVGYADGVPRAGGNRAPVLAAGAQRTIAGRVCMDQFVLDVGDDALSPGDEVVLWGPGTGGEPTAQQWADALDTIHYELVTRVGGRFTRRYVGTAGTD